MTLALTVTGADERGAPVAARRRARALDTRRTHGHRRARRVRHAGRRRRRHGDVGAATATTLIRVGDHTVARARVCRKRALGYDFTGAARAAYANAAIALPDEPVRLSLEVNGDGNGVPLRASFINRYGEKQR